MYLHMYLNSTSLSCGIYIILDMITELTSHNRSHACTAELFNSPKINVQSQLMRKVN